MKLSNIDDQPVREFAISHAVSDLACLRKGSWKITFAQKSGGYGGTVPDAPSGQLDNLTTDLGEMKDHWKDKPELVAELTAAMERIVAAHPNDVPVPWRRFLKTDAAKP